MDVINIDKSATRVTHSHSKLRERNDQKWARIYYTGSYCMGEPRAFAMLRMRGVTAFMQTQYSTVTVLVFIAAALMAIYISYTCRMPARYVRLQQWWECSSRKTFDTG